MQDAASMSTQVSRAVTSSVQGVVVPPVLDVVVAPVTSPQDGEVLVPAVVASVPPVLGAVVVPPLLPVATPTSQVDVTIEETPLYHDIVFNTETRHLNRRNSVLSSINGESDEQIRKKDRKLSKEHKAQEKSKEKSKKDKFFIHSIAEYNASYVHLVEQLGAITVHRKSF